jgi:hypothetical protein
VAHRHPGSSIELYLNGLSTLFNEEIACDVVFRAGMEEVHAHRCIVAARSKVLRDMLFASPEAREIVVEDEVFFRRPHFLRAVIASCYGVETEEGTDISYHANYFADPNVVPWYELAKLEPKTINDATQAQLLSIAPPDVFIVGTVDANPEADIDWMVPAHVPILCAYSRYARSALSHEFWAMTTKMPATDSEEGIERILRLDSMNFAEDTVIELVSACYGASLDMCDEPLESILQLADGAVYLGMTAASILCEEVLALRINATDLPDIIEYAESNGLQLLLLECHKYLCRNLKSVQEAGSLSYIRYEHMKTMLQSNFVETQEDEILNAVLAWSERTAAPNDKTAELISLVRLPFVPTDSPAMLRAVERGLIGEDMLRACRLFQTDADYRRTMINSEVLYSSRQSESHKDQLQDHLSDLMLTRVTRALESPPVLDHSFAILRMLGTVNGRRNFDQIRSIRLSESGDYLLCDSSESEIAVKEILIEPSMAFTFDGLETPSMASTEDKALQFVDSTSLQSKRVEDVEQLLAAMLRRENELRLHPQVQEVYGNIGDDEEEMSRFTTALQAHVASEFNVDTIVGIELIRSASSLFPETAKLAHYVRHNRCFRGSLCAGDEAPDVSLSTLTGETTKLWKEIDARRSKDGFTDEMPVVILGASFT